MSAPFRIERPINDRSLTLVQDDTGFKEYLSRLLKMIPAEIIGLYMIGNGFIPSNKPTVQVIWIFICFILIIILRIYGTADPAQDKPSQPIPVAISTIAFLIWVYWLGGPFIFYKIHIPYVASLLILVWSFIIPIFYKGPNSNI